MYKVTYSDNLDCLIGSVVFQGEKVESCLMFALELHRVSNVPHVVLVVGPDEYSIVVTLTAGLDEK